MTIPPAVQQLIQAAQAQAQKPIPEIVYVTFNAEITPQSAEGLLAVMANCATQGVKRVYLAMSTPGGDVTQGMTLYNVLKGMPFELTTHNVGNTDSIGNAVFLAGVKRYACPHATFMFHGVGFNMANQNVRLEEKNIREMLENITSNHKRIGTVLEERTKIDKALIPELFREAQTKDANFALANGIIDEIRDLDISPGSAVISLVFQR
jgi:ATP-dependent protease ClpP protease subunit